MTRLALFGASGRTGSEVVRRALERGWKVRALVRPSSHCEEQAGLELLRGDLDTPSDLLATVRNADAVLCVFGPRSAKDPPFAAAATGRIVEAMKSSGVRRLVCQTGAMIGDLPPNVSAPMRLMAGLVRRQCPALAADRAEQERLVMTSGLDWTLAKPPRLHDGPARRRTHADPALRVGLASAISRAALAEFLLDQTRSTHHAGRRLYVCET
ncbi:MAG TPA: NAD(P)H-binding protein [Acidobacteriota bacterium]|nr:NAD(P)H-binding protein [Acidobacteriota bacterium]